MEKRKVRLGQIWQMTWQDPDMDIVRNTYFVITQLYPNWEHPDDHMCELRQVDDFNLKTNEYIDVIEQECRGDDWILVSDPLEVNNVC